MTFRFFQKLLTELVHECENRRSWMVLIDWLDCGKDRIELKCSYFEESRMENLRKEEAIRKML